MLKKELLPVKFSMVKTEEDLDRFPSDAVLVTAYTSPRLGKVIKKASAIITDIGSPTGHMATIAREFRVPTIVNTGIATQLLHPDQIITVDARENVVYEGAVKALCYYEFAEEIFETTYEFRLLQRVLKQIAPLNLLDPSGKNFTPSGCKTLHDITRYVHEKAVEELIGLEYDKTSDTAGSGRKLKFDIPLDLILIDIGGGIKESASVSAVKPQEVISVAHESISGRTLSARSLGYRADVRGLRQFHVKSDPYVFIIHGNTKICRTESCGVIGRICQY